jgi:hypothetical protein
MFEFQKKARKSLARWEIVGIPKKESPALVSATTLQKM